MVKHKVITISSTQHHNESAQSDNNLHVETNVQMGEKRFSHSQARSKSLGDILPPVRRTLNAQAFPPPLRLRSSSTEIIFLPFFRSEEPAATNMDISTGHIVLSYMEDHLKNQDRLDREWEAVSGYVADPCSTRMAQDQANMRKNRFADILPCEYRRT
ncbi:receptor-type tyrosine-protein phosphatase N2 [Elysia marginata]|uniref:Receptor-type tyrosine-protein phosphatase N2 n=1 Tax=Elysia marginata TaxID=1093978 RepID=A0AAV4INP6_9GAST|nr:receptor-type tyrosine-protein phosphatase N2 [Elysia marginata]